MEALLLALLLVLLLDQGDHSQRLAGAIGGRFAEKPARALLLIALLVAVTSAIGAYLGSLLAALLTERPRLLFFAFTLISGGCGLLWTTLRPVASAPPSINGRLALLIARLGVSRLTDRAGFAILGVAALAGSAWTCALGGLIGGLAALGPALILGRAYGQFMPLRLINCLSGSVLLLAGVASALRALTLW